MLQCHLGWAEAPGEMADEGIPSQMSYASAYLTSICLTIFFFFHVQHDVLGALLKSTVV